MDLEKLMAVARGKPDVSNIPVLRKALLGDDDAEARYAADALRRLGPKACDAVDDLIAAASVPWKFGCPQRFCNAMEALLKIAPDHPRLVALCREVLSCQNYGIQKSAILSLLHIRSPEAMAILRDIDGYRDSSIQGKPFENLMVKVLKELRGLEPGA